MSPPSTKYDRVDSSEHSGLRKSVLRHSDAKAHPAFKDQGRYSRFSPSNVVGHFIGNVSTVNFKQIIGK